MVAEHLPAEALSPVIESDGELTVEEMTLDMARELADGGPWGQQFPEPLFDGEFELLAQRIVGERHLKMRLRPVGGSVALDAIAFRVDTQRWPDPAATRVHAAYRMDVNEWRGERSLQLLVEQLQPC